MSKQVYEVPCIEEFEVRLESTILTNSPGGGAGGGGKIDDMEEDEE